MMSVPDPAFRQSDSGLSGRSGPRLPDSLWVPDLGTGITDLAYLTMLVFSKPRLSINFIKYTTIILLNTNFFHFSGFIRFISGTV